MELTPVDGEAVSRFPESWATEQYCYLSTAGRRTGEPHEVEIWFGMREGKIYMLSGRGERADWVKNLRHDPEVTVRVAGQTRNATARVVPESNGHPARKVIAAKYRGWREGDPLSSWATGAPLIAVSPESR